jgi:hypothetical protein
MAFTFGKSEIDLTYLGKSYTLKVTTRLAVDLERTMDMHPLTLAMKINKASIEGVMPPMGLMAEFFEFMLKKAGATVDFDELYSQLFDGEASLEIAGKVGELLGLFIPQNDEIEDAPKDKPKKAKK